MSPKVRRAPESLPESSRRPSSAVWPTDEAPTSSSPISSSSISSDSPSEPQIGQAYAELEGGQGREVFFRPHRYQRDDLGSVRPVVHVAFGRPAVAAGAAEGLASRECSLHDVSQNGIAFELPSDISLEIGAVLPELVLSFDGHEVYRGEVRVGSLRALENKTIVGASLLDSLMNIDDVLLLRDVKAWMSPGTEGLGLASPSWRVSGHDRFKALVAEFGLFLHDAERELARLESSVPWHVVHSEQPSAARGALIKRIGDEFVVPFIRYAEDIDAASRSAGAEDLQRLKDFSRRYLQAMFLESPCLHRAFLKPLGYPGDYEVMRYMYENMFAGSTLFAKSLNLAIMSTRAVAAVRARKDVVKERVSALLEREASPRPVRVLAIASGPAEEIYELLNERSTIAPTLEIVLFDQDTRALSFAYSRLKRIVDARWPGRVRVVYLHDSIKRLLRDPHIFAERGRFDLVFSCGLFDYLELRTAVTLCRNLFANLSEGADLFIGNMVPTNPNRWIMDLHLDWPLVYRTRSEMIDFARLAAPDAHIEIVEERTGLNPFVRLTRT